MRKPLAPSSVLRTDFSFVDIESTGLLVLSDPRRPLSYPVEIGWVDDSLTGATSFLVKPHATWPLDQLEGDGFRIHGISRERLFDEGVDVAEAAERLVEMARGKGAIVSDSPHYDEFWLNALFFAAIGERAPFAVTEFKDVVWRHMGMRDWRDAEFHERHRDAFEIVNALWPHPHRAAIDAVQTAAVFRILVDTEFRDLAMEHMLYLENERRRSRQDHEGGRGRVFGSGA